ncbi:MAG: type II toxin-antitoxin system RelE/ParE family toxin [Verrucomicrobiales bacterium]|nr:type II toxin-antitoxin system RelE/ParE family toxin [Verrucomicrobiales bacterium]
MRIRVLDSALEDLDRARHFYEHQAEGLGMDFLEVMFAQIDSLASYGGVHRKVFGYHRLITRRFPYAVYYRVEGNRVVVWRVLDLRQSPAKISRALS